MRSTQFKPIRSFVFAASVLAVLSGSPTRLAAQPESAVARLNREAADTEITVMTVRNNISMMAGSGGNITVLTGADGKLLVDVGISISEAKIQAALKSISTAPLKYVINTHWHWDHSDGNEWASRSGATIIAQENALRRLSNTERVEDWNYTFQPAAVGGRPTITYKKDKTLRFNGETILLKNYGVGHTDGDTSVYFKDADVLALGDIYWNGQYPYIDTAHGGGIDHTIRWVNESLKLAGDKTLIIPGHGPIGDRAALVAYRDMLVDARGIIARLKKQGMSIEAVLDAKPLAAYDAKWGASVVSTETFVRLVYRGV